MQKKMGTTLTYRHELGLNYNRILPDLIVGSCLQVCVGGVFGGRCIGAFAERGAFKDRILPASLSWPRAHPLASSLVVRIASPPTSSPSRALPLTHLRRHPTSASFLRSPSRLGSPILQWHWKALELPVLEVLRPWGLHSSYGTTPLLQAGDNHVRVKPCCQEKGT